MAPYRRAALRVSVMQVVDSGSLPTKCSRHDHPVSWTSPAADGDPQLVDRLEQLIDQVGVPIDEAELSAAGTRRRPVARRFVAHEVGVHALEESPALAAWHKARPAEQPDPQPGGRQHRAVMADGALEH